MAAPDVGKARRRPTTYGKASRKYLTSYDQASIGPCVREQATELVLDGARSTGLGSGRWGTSTDWDKGYGEGEVHNAAVSLQCRTTPSNRKEETLGKTQTPIKLTSTIKGETDHSTPSQQLTPYNDMGDLTIFDVPSSDDYHYVGKRRSEAEASRKRKRPLAVTDGGLRAICTAVHPHCNSPRREVLDEEPPTSTRHGDRFALEDIKARKDTRMITRTFENPADRNNGPCPTSKCKGSTTKGGNVTSRVDSERSKGCVRSGEGDTILGETISASGQKPLGPSFQTVTSKTHQSKPSLFEALEPTSLKSSVAPVEMRATRILPCANPGTVRVENRVPATNFSRIAPFTASHKTFSSVVGSVSDAYPANHDHVGELKGEATLVLDTDKRSEQIKVEEGSQIAEHVRPRPAKLVDALNRHHSLQAQRASDVRGVEKWTDMEMDRLDMPTLSRNGADAAPLSASEECQPQNGGPLQGPTHIPSQGAPATQDGGPKITYARQRSYLTEDSFGEDQDFSIPIDIGTDRSRERGRRAGNKALPIISPLHSSLEEDAVVAGSSVGGIRSIHELREAGEKHNFMHGIESLFDDIENRQHWSVSQKRSSLLNLATQLAEPGFVLQFTECGLVQRLFHLGDGERDPIAQFLLASAIVFLLSRRPSKSPMSCMESKSARDFLLALLGAEDDIAALVKDRRTNLSKISCSEIIRFRTLVEQSPVWERGLPAKISSQAVALMGLELMVRQAQEAGDSSQFLSQGAVEHLVDIVATQRRKLNDSGEPAFNYVTGRLALSILDACTTGSRPATDGIQWNTESISKLSDLLPPVSECYGEDAAELRNLILRLYLNLNNTSSCETLSTPRVIHAIFSIIDSHFHTLSQQTEEAMDPLLLDNLILSLGSLINLAEWSDSTRVAVLTPQIGNVSILESLMQVFLSRIEVASKASKRCILLSLLLTLVGRVCRRKPLQCPFWVSVSTFE